MWEHLPSTDGTPNVIAQAITIDLHATIQDADGTYILLENMYAMSYAR